MAQKCHFLATNSVFWAQLVSLMPPHPVLQVLESNKMFFRVGEPENGCFRAACPKKWPFLPNNGLKMPISAQKTVFFGSGSQFDAPTLFWRCLTQRNMCCRVGKPENG